MAGKIKVLHSNFSKTCDNSSNLVCCNKCNDHNKNKNNDDNDDDNDNKEERDRL